MITAERLRELLDYDPKTGIFTWRIDRPRASAGDPAGCIATKDDGRKYLVIRISGKNYYAHRLAFLWMTGEFPEGLVDHKYGDGLDNRWETVRACSPLQNSMNKIHRGVNNTSGFLGVYPVNGLWASQITIKGVTKTLGTFDTAELAARARDAAAKELHGEFAALNFDDDIPAPKRPVLRRGSKNEFRGVSFREHANRFAASVRFNGVSVHLGYFDTAEEAAHVRDDAARIAYGKKAILNFP